MRATIVPKIMATSFCDLPMEIVVMFVSFLKLGPDAAHFGRVCKAWKRAYRYVIEPQATKEDFKIISKNGKLASLASLLTNSKVKIRQDTIDEILSEGSHNVRELVLEIL